MMEQAAGSRREPSSGSSAPRFHKFKIGQLHATVISDGIMDIGDPVENFSGMPPDRLRDALSRHSLSPSRMRIQQNALVVDDGVRRILFDTGLGSIDLWGPSTGRLMHNLVEAGIRPDGISAVVLSHAHIDHLSGCMRPDGTRNFPNAEYFIAKADHDFWTDFGNVPASHRVFVEAARNNLLPNRERITFIEGGEGILPCVRAIAAPGHTLGHTVFLLESAEARLCYVADLVHHPVLSMENPALEFMHDTDAKRAVDTRIRLLSWLADEGIPVLAYHFPWPGLGYVGRHGSGFQFRPDAMVPAL